MWLPYYIQTGLGKEGSEKEELAILYDVGAIVGTIAAGWYSDRLGGLRMLVLEPMLVAAIPILVVFRVLTDDLFWVFYILAPAAGAMIGGVASIVSSAVAADLGRRADVG
jgi:sugar phosphate permease